MTNPVGGPAKPTFEVAYFPYIGLREVSELRFGQVTVWNSDLLSSRVQDPALRTKISALLQTNRSASHTTRDSQPIRNIGILTIGASTFEPFTKKHELLAQEMRYVLFLCALAHNARLNGPNAGHLTYTSENFDLVRQTFALDGDYFAESTGTIVRFRIMGYKVSETRFPKPSYVPEPIAFNQDKRLFQQLAWLKRHSRTLYRRIIRATAVFLESYYNASAVYMGARVLMQAAAFEILLDLPDQGQRKTFKDLVEHLTNNASERRYSYTFEMPGAPRRESRSLKGIWADRFYTLRNHIVHGNEVSDHEFMFRRSQHHVLIAALFFVSLIKRLIEGARKRRELNPVFFERIDWTRLQEADEYEEERNGFKLNTDFTAMYVTGSEKAARVEE